MATIVNQLKSQLKQQGYQFLEVFISKNDKKMIFIDFPENYSEQKIKQLNKDLKGPLNKIGFKCEARTIFQFNK